MQRIEREVTLYDMIMGKALRQLWIEMALDVTFVDSQREIFLGMLNNLQEFRK